MDMVKEKHRHQLATAMLSKDQDTQPSKERQKGKDPPTWQGDKGKGKGACYRRGQMGHMAKDCRVRVYNVTEATGEQSTDQQQYYYEEHYNQQQYDPHYQQWSAQEVLLQSSTTCI